MIVTRCSFGHQDAITALDSLSRERCVTAGGRDRSVRVWKIAEEYQLVFHGHEWVSICLSSGDSVSHCLHCWVQMFIYCQSCTKTQWDTLFSWRKIVKYGSITFQMWNKKTLFIFALPVKVKNDIKKLGADKTILMLFVYVYYRHFVAYILYSILIYTSNDFPAR